MDDNKSEIGGFVECCDGVEDPLLLLSIILGEKIQVSTLIYFLNKIPFHQT